MDCQHIRGQIIPPHVGLLAMYRWVSLCSRHKDVWAFRLLCLLLLSVFGRCCQPVDHECGAEKRSNWKGQIDGHFVLQLGSVQCDRNEMTETEVEDEWNDGRRLAFPNQAEKLVVLVGGVVKAVVIVIVMSAHVTCHMSHDVNQASKANGRLSVVRRLSGVTP